MGKSILPVPGQNNFMAAVIGILTKATRIGTGALPLKINAAPRSVGIAGN